MPKWVGEVIRDASKVINDEWDGERDLMVQVGNVCFEYMDALMEEHGLTRDQALASLASVFVQVIKGYEPDQGDEQLTS